MHDPTTARSFAAITLALSATLSLAAQDRSPGAATPPSEALLFKSGQAFVYRQVDIEPGSELTTLRLPDAIHGTVWLGSDDVQLHRAIARREPQFETRPVSDMMGVVLRAVGHRVTLTLQQGDTVEHITGVVQRTLDVEANDYVYSSGRAMPGAPQRRANLLVVQTDTASILLPISSIIRVSSESAALATAEWDYAHPVDGAVLDVRHAALAAEKQAGRVGLAAMTNGLTWTPSYVLELGADARARLVGKAVIVNDSERLVDTLVRLAIGFPNLQFAGVPSSLRPDVALETFRTMLQSGSASADRNLGAMSQIMGNMISVAPARGSISGPAGAIEGESAEDLYLYDIGRVTLDKGERAYVPLLDAQVPFAHVYEWELPDEVDDGRFVRAPDAETPPVWHVLMLDNITQAPWTTAPILIQGTRGPIAQSMLEYTPAGAKGAKVKLTKALNIVGESVEFRADDATATRKEIYLFGNRLEEVEVRGLLTLNNHSDKTVPMRIRKSFSGDLVSSEQEAVVRGRAKRLHEFNASRTLEWEFELAPGAEWKNEYRYRVLIHR